MHFIDSHAHLTDEAFDGDRAEMIARARTSGAGALVCIATSCDDADAAHALSEEHAGFVAFTSGVHPHDAASWDHARDPGRIRVHAAAGAVAIGECGLDYHYDYSPRELQRRAFAGQLELARETGRPVIVHTRDAAEDTEAMMREASSAGVRGVLHCFTGPASLGEAALECGWHLSFSGIVTFPRFTDTALLRLPPDDRVLVESDSPYLAPVPHRGKRNEPAWVSFTVVRLAAARGVTPEEMGRLAADTTRAFFGLAYGAPPQLQ